MVQIWIHGTRAQSDSIKHGKVIATSILEHNRYLDQALTKLTRLHDESHPTPHRPASLWRNYSLPVGSIMELAMEKGLWWWRTKIPLSGAQNGLQIYPPEEEQGLAAALYRKTRWNFLPDFFLSESEYMELGLRSVESQGAHKAGSAPCTPMDRVWAPDADSFANIFY